MNFNQCCNVKAITSNYLNFNLLGTSCIIIIYNKYTFIGATFAWVIYIYLNIYNLEQNNLSNSNNK